MYNYRIFFQGVSDTLVLTRKDSLLYNEGTKGNEGNK